MAATRRKTRAHHLPDQYLTCRDRSLGHDWDVIGPMFGLRKPQRPGEAHELTRHCRCTNCATERIEFFAHVGPGGYLAKLTNRTRYLYPAEYSLPYDPDEGPLGATEVYEELYRRHKPKRGVVVEFPTAHNAS